MTRWGIIAGTPQYMSPEQARGEPVDGRSDLFSLGCVLYEMATGVSPFRADSTLATLRRLIDDPPPAIDSLNPELPPWFVGIVDRLLEKDPARRFGSAKEVSELLEGCLAHLQQPSGVPLPTGLPAPVAHTSRRRRRLFLTGTFFMVTTFAIGLVGLLLMQATDRSKPEPPPLVAERLGDSKPEKAPEKTAGLAAPIAKLPEGAVEHLQSLIERGMLDDALAAYRKQPIPSLLMRLGEALKRDGRGLEMLDLYEGFLLTAPTGTASEPGDSSPLGLAGGVISQIVEVGAADAAAKRLSEQTAAHPREAWLRLRLGYLWWKTGQREKAVTEFDQYTILWNKPSALGMGWLAQLYAEGGLTDKAIASYKEALKIPITAEDLHAVAMRAAMYRPPERIRSEFKADLLARLGELFRKEKRWPEAERCYLDILDLDPPVRKDAAEAALSAIWKVIGKDNTLIAQLRRQLAAAPDKAEVHAELARLLMATGKTEEGIERYRAAVKLAPAQLGYLLNLADALASAGKDDEAVAEYGAALKAAIALPPPRRTHKRSSNAAGRPQPAGTILILEGGPALAPRRRLRCRKRS